jgi:hypothetical protein
MSTAAPASVSELSSRQLPMFEGFKVPRARLAFAGGLEMTLTNPEDVALIKALKWGAEATVTIAVDGHDRELVLGAKCVGRSYRFRKMEDSDSAVSVHRIVINDVRDGDEDPEGDD